MMPLRLSVLLAVACRSETQIEGPAPEPPEPAPPPAPELSVPGEEIIEQDPQCTVTYACPRDDPAWDAIVEWEEVLEPVDAYGWLTHPVVAELDGDETPEIALGSSRNDWPSSWNTYLSVWNGDGSGLVASFPQTPLTMAPSAVAAADVDGDGQPELVVSVLDDPNETDEIVRRIGPHRLAALRMDGTTLWESEPYLVPVFQEDDWYYVNRLAPAVADLEGDGSVEVFADGWLFDGATGQTLGVMPEVKDLRWGTTTVADLDLDGVSEIVHLGRVLDARAQVLWEVDVGGASAYPAVVQLDLDPEQELVFATGDAMHAYDTDGTPLWTQVLRESDEDSYGSPCVADFDGDGELEIVGTFGPVVAMLELSGELVWAQPALEYSMSCAGFDLDLDGRAEVAVLGDGLHLLCGADGKLLYEDTSRPNTGAHSYPVVADLDGDDSAEIVAVTADYVVENDPEPDLYWQSDGTSSLVVYGHPEGLWPETVSAWPQYDGPRPEGLVHTPPAEGELRPVDPPEVVPSPDLGLRLADQLGGCGGLSLSVQAENHGTMDAPAGHLLVMEAIDAASLGTYQTRPLRTLTLPALPAGVRQAAVRFDLAPEELGAWGLRLSIPVDPLRPECDPDDQELIIPFPCPDAGGPP